MKPYRVLYVILCLTLCQIKVQADLDPIVTAANIFVISDATVNVSNIQGQSIIQGNGSFRTDNIGSIHAQGDLNLNVVNVRGNVAVGGTLTQKASRVGSITHLGKPGTDFSGINQTLFNQSEFLGSLKPDGLVQVNSLTKTITLTGTSPDINIFEVNALWFHDSLQVKAPMGSTVIVNMPGDQIDFSLVSLNAESIEQDAFDPKYLLFNFPQATSIMLSSSKVVGTILAPLASVNAQSVSISGGLIANSLRMTTSNLYDNRFQGQLSSENRTLIVPEPSAFLLFSVAGSLAALYCQIRQMRNLLANLINKVITHCSRT